MTASICYTIIRVNLLPVALLSFCLPTYLKYARSGQPVGNILTSAQSTEILAGLWDHVRSQLHDNLAKRSAISGDFEENTRQTHCVVGGEID